MRGILLRVEGLTKNFGGIHALRGFSCSLREGSILGLIGPNGAGKTTLFNVVSGFLVPDQGRVLLGSTNLVGLAPYQVARAGIARTFQEVRLVRRLSVVDNVLLSFGHQPGERLWNVFCKWKRWKDCEARNQCTALSLLSQAGLEHEIHRMAGELSYGQQKLLSLVCCLAADAAVLLLDEPVAGLAPTMVDRILGTIRHLAERGKSAVVIEHDLDAVTRICDRVVFMDSGTSVCEGTAQEVRNDPRVIEAYIT